MVENLIRHTLAWENEKHKQFLYDGVGFPKFFVRTFKFLFLLYDLSNWLFCFCVICLQVRLVSILEDYKLTRIQKEEEKKRSRVNKFK